LQQSATGGDAMQTAEQCFLLAKAAAHRVLTDS
jgi:hypothetical protein